MLIALYEIFIDVFDWQTTVTMEFSQFLDDGFYSLICAKTSMLSGLTIFFSEFEEV